MAYRDEEEGLRLRIEELEGELAEAHAVIARLRGDVAVPPAEDGIDGFTGVHKTVSLERTLPFAVSEQGLVAIADLLDERIPGGTSSQIGDTFKHAKGAYHLRITRTDGATEMKLFGDYRPVRTQLFIGSPGLAFLGAVMMAGVFSAMRMGSAGMAVGAVLGAVAGFWLLRLRIKNAMDKDRRNLIASFEQVAELVGRHRIEVEPVGGARIEASNDAASEAEVRAELEQAELEAQVDPEAERVSPRK